MVLVDLKNRKCNTVVLPNGGKCVPNEDPIEGA